MVKVHTIKGTFVEEIKNRFLCSVLIDGCLEECYVPSSTRLSNFFDLSGVPVLLTENNGKKTRTRYKLLAVCLNNKWILINLGLLNEIFFEYYQMSHQEDKAFREKKVEGVYKADLYIDSSIPKIYEVKGILSTDQEVVFPSIIGERAVKQLSFFNKMLGKNKYNIEYVVVMLSESINKIRISRTDEKYLRLFRSCVRRGMKVSFFYAVCEEDEIKIVPAEKVNYR